MRSWRGLVLTVRRWGGRIFIELGALVSRMNLLEIFGPLECHGFIDDQS